MDTSALHSDACRLCDENKEKMHSIFSKNEEGQQLLHLIKECLPVIVSIWHAFLYHQLLMLNLQIYRTDPLSKQICHDCFSKLETFYKFKKTSLATATRHKKHLLNTENNSNKRIQLYLSCEDTETVVFNHWFCSRLNILILESSDKFEQHSSL